MYIYLVQTVLDVPVEPTGHCVNVLTDMLLCILITRNTRDLWLFGCETNPVTFVLTICRDF